MIHCSQVCLDCLSDPSESVFLGISIRMHTG